MCHLTLKKFLHEHDNFMSIFKKNQIDLEFLAKTNMQDAIADGDLKQSKWYLDYLQRFEIHQQGNKIHIEGELNTKLIFNFDSEDEDNIKNLLDGDD